MDERLRLLWKAWRSSGDAAAGSEYLRARIRAGSLDWGSVEAAAFLGEPSCRELLGEDALALVAPRSGFRTLCSTVLELAGGSDELELRLVVGMAHGSNQIGEPQRSLVPRVLGAALAALDGEPDAEARLSMWIQRYAEEDGLIHQARDTREFLLPHLERLVRGEPPPPPPGTLVEEALALGRESWNKKRGRAGVDRALLPWLVAREVEPRGVEPALAREREERCSVPNADQLYAGGPLTPAETDAIRAALGQAVPPRLISYDLVSALRALYEVRGWRYQGDGYLLAPGKKRRLKWVAATGLRLEVLDSETGEWRGKLSHAGRVIPIKPFGPPILAALRALESA